MFKVFRVSKESKDLKVYKDFRDSKVCKDCKDFKETRVSRELMVLLVGKVLKVTAGGTTAGSSEVTSQAYVFYLKSKPAGSQVILNGPPTSAVASVIPDVAGAYTFAVRVFGSDEKFIYSDEATLTVEVAPASE